MMGLWNSWKWIWETFGPAILLGFGALKTAILAIASIFLSVTGLLTALPQTLFDGLKDLPALIVDAIISRVKESVVGGRTIGKVGGFLGGITSKATQPFTDFGAAFSARPTEPILVRSGEASAGATATSPGARQITINVSAHGLVDQSTLRLLGEEIAKEQRRGLIT